jgi:hypothetical protein
VAEVEVSRTEAGRDDGVDAGLLQCCRLVGALWPERCKAIVSVSGI